MTKNQINKKPKVGYKLYSYLVKPTNFGSIGVSFRAENRSEADKHAKEQAAIFGPRAVAHFKKEI